MPSYNASVTFLHLISAMFTILNAKSTSCQQADLNRPVQLARTSVIEARKWVQGSISRHEKLGDRKFVNGALSDCEKLYEESESLLNQVISGENCTNDDDDDDARAWLSGALVNSRTCLDGLNEMGFVEFDDYFRPQNLSLLLRKALASYNRNGVRVDAQKGERNPRENGGMLSAWNPASSRADFVVAKDGFGSHTTISDAVGAVARMRDRRSQRVVIYVKAGVYNEKVEIERGMNNIMFVGDGMDKTIVSANRNVPDGSTTFDSATFGVAGDGFWARDMTFENTAGPQKHQAVALRVNSDRSVFYRCSIKGYQDTLFVHSLRQFYRDCQIYGTIDFIFGDASAIFQNCDILVRRPMAHQANMITAQGREELMMNTGISIQNCRVKPAPEFIRVKNSFKTYLGRPWKKYSRTVFLKTDLDGLIDPRGWMEWEGSFGLSTLYYAEYMNTGVGALTQRRVKWPGFHVLQRAEQVQPFTVSNFIQGHLWIPMTGVPFSSNV